MKEGRGKNYSKVCFLHKKRFWSEHKTHETPDEVGKQYKFTDSGFVI